MKVSFYLFLFVGLGLFSTNIFSQINTFPYDEDFDAQATCGTGCGASCPSLTGGWFNVLTDDLDWLVDAGGTSTTGTGPTSDHTTGTATGNYIFVETSCSGTGYPNKLAEIESPWFDLSGATNYEFSFWYHAFGATQGNLTVLTRNGLNDPWTVFAGPITDNVNLWQEFSECISGGIGYDSTQYKFSYVTSTNFTGDIALDDFSIRSVDPFQVGLTSLSSSITGGCTLSSTESITVTICNYGDSLNPGTVIPLAFSLDSGLAVVENFTLPIGLSSKCSGLSCIDYTFASTLDLSALGSYTIQAWTQVPLDTDPSNDSLTITAVSLPSVTLPYFEDFESGPAGWIVDQGGNGTWAFGAPNKIELNGAASGDSCFVVGGLAPGSTYNANENSNITSPCIDISNATGEELLSLKINWSSEFSWDGANIFGSVDGGSTWNQLGNFNAPLNWYNDNSIGASPNGSQEGWTGDGVSGSGGWVCASHKLDSALMVNNSSLRVRIGFGSDGSVQKEGIAFDDISIGIPVAYDLVPDSIFACDAMVMVDAGAAFTFAVWSNSSQGGGLTGNPATLTSSLNGTVFVTVSDTLGHCVQDEFNLNVVDFVPPDIEDVTLCNGDSVVFDAEVGPVGTLYSWSNGDTLQTTTIYSPGQVNIFKIDTLNGCSASDSATMYYLDVNLQDLSACEGDTVILDATSTSPTTTYVWSTGDSTSTISVASSDSYGVVVTDSLQGQVCFYEDSMTLIINPLPIPEITGQVDSVCANTSFDLNGGTGYASYSWSTGGTTQIENVDASTLGLGFNDITLVVLDGNGCSNSDSVIVFVDECADLNDLEQLTLSIYPNPSEGLFNYTINGYSGNVSLTVTDLSGKKVMEGSLNEESGNIDLSNCENGLYIMTLQHGVTTSTVRLVKQ